MMFVYKADPIQCDTVVKSLSNFKLLRLFQVAPWENEPFNF